MKDIRTLASGLRSLRGGARAALVKAENDIHYNITPTLHGFCGEMQAISGTAGLSVSV